MKVILEIEVGITGRVDAGVGNSDVDGDVTRRITSRSMACAPSAQAMLAR